MVFSLNIRFHTEGWPKWDSSPQPRAYHAHGLTTVIVIIYICIYIYIYIYILYIDLFICIVYIYIYIYIYNIYFYFIIFQNTCRFLLLTMAFTSKCHSQATPSSEQR